MNENFKRPDRVFRDIMRDKNMRRALGTKSKQEAVLKGLELASKTGRTQKTKMETFLDSIKDSHRFKSSEQKIFSQGFSNETGHHSTSEKKTVDRKALYDEIMGKRKIKTEIKSNVVESNREESQVLNFGVSNANIRKATGFMGSKSGNKNAEEIRKMIEGIQS